MTRIGFAWVAGAVALATMMARAHAGSLAPAAGQAMVVGSTSQLVMGGYGTDQMTLQLPSAGDLFLTLTDMNFPDPFASLQDDLIGPKGMLMQPSAPGTESMLITGPQTLYVNVFAQDSAGVGIGLFNLTATFVPATAPVSLPTSGGLLGGVTALALLLDAALRRREQTTVTTAVA